MSPSQPNAWLHRLRSVDQPERTLICLPHAGGGPALFRRWPADLPATIEILAVQLPGRGSRFREAPYERIEPLLQALVPTLLSQLSGAPVALFGHSFGGLLAFELVHALQAEGVQIMALFVSACHPPQHLPPDEILRDLPRSALLSALQRFDGMPQELLAEAELLDMIFPALRADLAVYETYVYRQRPKLSVPIIAFGGRNDTRVTPAQLEAWCEQTAAYFERHLFAGSHFYLNDVHPQLMKLIERMLAL